MRDYFILLVYLSFFFYARKAPFVLYLGYVWVDIFTPQLVAYNLLSGTPVSQLIGIAALGAIFFLKPLKEVSLQIVGVLLIVFSIWMTLTLFWAVLPVEAFDKWNWAIKSVLAAVFLPYFVRTRIEMEALIWIIVAAGMAHCIPFAAKVLISGSGYGQAKGLISANSGYGESSTLSMFAVSLAPFCLFLIKHSKLIQDNKYRSILLVTFLIAAVVTSLGTFARTGLICSTVFATALVLRSRNRIALIFLITLASASLVSIMGEEWSSRMESITDGSDTSAMGRVAVWLWTLDFVKDNPLGGGFGVSMRSVYEYQLANGDYIFVNGKAFHNIYFEVLGETGVIGITIYFSIIIATISTLKTSMNQSKSQETAWRYDLSVAVMTSYMIFLVGGMFIGIAFQSYFYYLAAITVSIKNSLSVISNER